MSHVSNETDRDLRVRSVRQFRRFAIMLSLVGILVQLALSAYYLDVAHSPQPRDVPVGLLGPAEARAGVTTQLQRDGAFAVTGYDSVAALTRAIQDREIYGGLDLGATPPRLYVPTAAGPSVAALLRSTLTMTVQGRTAQRVRTLTAPGKPIPAATVRALTTPPSITDVAPLPDADRNGAALSFMVQSLALGGTVASTGLGRLIPRTRRSWRRGLGHLATLVVYAAGSAAVVLLSMSLFGVGSHADRVALFGEFFWVSLAITASTAGFVALVGPLGAVAGVSYFAVGTAISGATIPPEFLPDVAHYLGQALPTGAGVGAIRDSLYFPEASVGQPLTVLFLYAGLGCLTVLVTNVRANRSKRISGIGVPGDA